MKFNLMIYHLNRGYYQKGGKQPKVIKVINNRLGQMIEGAGVEGRKQ